MSNPSKLQTAIYEASNSKRTPAEKVDAVITVAEETLERDAREAVKLLLGFAEDFQPSDEKEKIVAAVLEHNKTLGQLDWGAATQNLYRAAKLTEAGSDNDKEMAAQIISYINDPKLVKIGQFRLGLETVQHSLNGSEMHRVAVNKTLQILGELSGADKVIALKELQKLEAKGIAPLIDGARHGIIDNNITQPPSTTVEATQRAEPVESAAQLGQKVQL